MSNTITSTNMSLPIPIPGVDAGPDYANNLAACLVTLDSHNHTPGSGIQLTPASLNINSAVAFNGYSATSLSAVVFQAQPSLATELATYVIGNDLYYNDGSGNVVRITQSGSVTGATGTITGLPSGTAGAAYSAGTFTFTSASLTGANLDGASVVLRNNSASSKGLTLSPPNAMAANYGLTLPSLPASTLFLTLDNTGALTTSNSIQGTQIATGSLVGGQLANATITGTQIAAATVTKANQVAVGQQVSSSSGSYSMTSSTFADVTNLTVTITTSGRPVRIYLIPDGTAAAATLFTTSSSFVNLKVIRGASTLVGWFVAGSNSGNQDYMPGCMDTIDTQAAGTYTYKVQCAYSAGNVGPVGVTNCKLVAYEL